MVDDEAKEEAYQEDDEDLWWILKKWTWPMKTKRDLSWVEDDKKRSWKKVTLKVNMETLRLWLYGEDWFDDSSEKNSHLSDGIYEADLVLTD